MKLLRSQDRVLPCGYKRMTITFNDQVPSRSRASRTSTRSPGRCPRCKRRFRASPSQVREHTEKRTGLVVGRDEVGVPGPVAPLPDPREM